MHSGCGPTLSRCSRREARLPIIQSSRMPTPCEASVFDQRVWAAQTATGHGAGAVRGGYAADAAERQLPEQWQQLVSVFSELSQSAATLPLSVLVCGSKNTGKSSFARLLVNALLSQHGIVAYLDTDCGQPELTAPGESPTPLSEVFFIVADLKRKRIY